MTDLIYNWSVAFNILTETLWHIEHILCQRIHRLTYASEIGVWGCNIQVDDVGVALMCCTWYDAQHFSTVSLGCVHNICLYIYICIHVYIFDYGTQHWHFGTLYITLWGKEKEKTCMLCKMLVRSTLKIIHRFGLVSCANCSFPVMY